MGGANDERELERWKVKTAAWIHDPPEKPVVLMRDPRGHEGGTVRMLEEALFGKAHPYRELVKRADWWASAADRIDLPRDAGWEVHRNDFMKNAFLVHPLRMGKGACVDGGDGEGWGRLDLGSLAAYGFERLQRAAQDWLEVLAFGPGGKRTPPADQAAMWRALFLRWWRLGPFVATNRNEVAQIVEGGWKLAEPPSDLEGGDRRDEGGGKLADSLSALCEWGALWSMLPADTRCPDHSIWEHVGFASALAGAFAGGGHPALLAVSLGPVQSFIARSRTTSDLWAGSHLLSTMAWEAMRVVCEAYGPDAVIFPNLRGVPIVDKWIVETARGPIAEDAWKALWRVCGKRVVDRTSDQNALFVATLPNRFLALVPADDAAALAKRIEETVRAWVKEKACEAWAEVAKVGGADEAVRAEGIERIERTLARFPEVAWATVPFPREGDGEIDAEGLRRALVVLTGREDPEIPGVSGEREARLKAAVKEAGKGLFPVRPSATYPAVWEAVERLLAATKAARPFDQLEHAGVRDSLGGDEPALGGNGSEAIKAFWKEVHEKKPSWAKDGERLGPLGVLKRVWPRLFVVEVNKFLEKFLEAHEEADSVHVERYVVSTHTMAMASSIERIVRKEQEGADVVAKLGKFHDKWLRPIADRFGKERLETPSLPARTYRRLQEDPDGKVRKVLRKTMALIEAAEDRERDDEASNDRTDRRTVEDEIRRGWKAVFGEDLERYYAVVLMDGDGMGALLRREAGRNGQAPAFGEILPGHIAALFRDEGLGAYLDVPTVATPAYHASLSAALNTFATYVAPTVVERFHTGKVIYAGGDDLLALVTTANLLSLMTAVRWAYSGLEREFDGRDTGDGILRFANGFVYEGPSKNASRLRRTLGHDATASMGVVIAHAMSPLGLVLDHARKAEQRAKREGGRDAFSITLFKRAGGLSYLTCGWHPDLAGAGDRGAVGVIERLRDAFSSGGMSRRAAYLAADWLEDLPEPCDGTPGPGQIARADFYDLVRTYLEHQFRQQLPRGRRGSAPEAGDEAPSAGGGGAEFVDARELARGVVALLEAEVARRRAKEKQAAPLDERAFVRDLLGVAEFMARAERGGAA